MVYIDESLEDKEAISLLDNQLIDVLIIKPKRFNKIYEKGKHNFEPTIKMIYYYNSIEGKIL